MVVLVTTLVRFSRARQGSSAWKRQNVEHPAEQPQEKSPGMTLSRDSWRFVENMLTKISKAQPRSALRQARKHAHRAKNSLLASPTPFDFLDRDPHMMHAV